MTQHTDVVVVGGGQAGPAADHHLRRQGLDFVTLEAETAPTGLRSADRWAAPLDENDVAPDAAVALDPLPRADDAETGTPVEGEAAGVLGEDPGLDHPHTVRSVKSTSALSRAKAMPRPRAAGPT